MSAGASAQSTSSRSRRTVTRPAQTTQSFREASERVGADERNQEAGLHPAQRS
jgi:hypothetical protein